MSLPSKEQLLETAFQILENAGSSAISHESRKAHSSRAKAYILLAREVPDTKAKDRPFSDAASL